MGAACNQSPECVAVAASNLALSTSLDVLERSWSTVIIIALTMQPRGVEEAENN